ncbi:MAG: AAA family ATPase [Pseudonocardiaceae bacterium]|nr:AAA family ATPase [Pseudonocardiaceae bacterium]
MDTASGSRQQLDKLHILLERRALLIVAGLPGAGKSTLLRGAQRDAPVDVPITVLDTDQVRARLAAALPPGTPFAWYRPLAPVVHRLRLLITAVLATGPVVVHHPATGAAARIALAVLGALCGRPCHLLWVDCTPDEALAGQHQRGRVRLKWSFARHANRAERARARLRAPNPPWGWKTVTVIDRPAAARGLHLAVV